jgi:serine/arginine repetitive matrix protein 2
MTIYGTELPIPFVRPGRQRTGAGPNVSQRASSIASLVRLGENDHFALFPPFHPWCVAINQLTSPFNNVANPQRLDKRTSTGYLNSLKVASNDAHMETPESQAQDTLIMNGAAEASTSFPPASPPPAVLPALSDLSTTAEQGKDGRRFVVASSCFVHPCLNFFAASTTVVSSSTVPPKKFSAVKINKRFMEQNSSAPGASQTLSSSPSSKIASTTGTFHAVRVTAHFPCLTSDLAKSPPPTATSHPRLVTKLTKLPASSAGTSSGWTRPSSTTPSLAPSPVSGGVPVASPPAPAPASHGPPQLPHVGKVIQPQPRGAIQTPSTSKSESANGSSKLAWRNVKPGGSTPGVGPPPGVHSEFPTAAEAQGAFV